MVRSSSRWGYVAVFRQLRLDPDTRTGRFGQTAPIWRPNISMTFFEWPRTRRFSRPAPRAANPPDTIPWEGAAAAERKGSAMSVPSYDLFIEPVLRFLAARPRRCTCAGCLQGGSRNARTHDDRRWLPERPASRTALDGPVIGSSAGYSSPPQHGFWRLTPRGTVSLPPTPALSHPRPSPRLRRRTCWFRNPTVQSRDRRRGPAPTPPKPPSHGHT